MDSKNKTVIIAVIAVLALAIAGLAFKKSVLSGGSPNESENKTAIDTAVKTNTTGAGGAAPDAYAPPAAGLAMPGNKGAARGPK
jgi:hypothetical protein